VAELLWKFLLHLGTTMAIAAILLLIWEGQPPHGCQAHWGRHCSIYFLAAFAFAQLAR